MDIKKVGMALIVCLLFAGIATATIETAITPETDTSNKPTEDAIIKIETDDETVLINEYGLKGSIDDDFTVQDVKNYENKTISFRLYKENLFNGTETNSTNLFKCVEFDSKLGECLREEPKTVAELNAEKKALIEEKIAIIAEITRTRNTQTPPTAVVGTGNITKEK